MLHVPHIITNAAINIIIMTIRNEKKLSNPAGLDLRFNRPVLFVKNKTVRTVFHVINGDDL